MKILIIKTFAEYVDVTASTYNLQEIGLARAFNRRGYQCDIVYFGGKINKTVDLYYDNEHVFHVFYLKALNVLKNGIYFKIDELAKKYDVLHCGGYDQIQSWILAGKFPEKLVIYNGPYYSEFNTGYNKKCKIFDKLFLPRYKKYNICFDTKSNLSTKFLKDKGLKNVNTIGVGIDLEQLQSKKLIKSEFSEELQQLKNNKTAVISYIGRLEPRRNIIFLLDTFNELLKIRPNSKLVIIGKGDEEYKAKCFEHIKQLNIGENIIYKEYMKQELLPAIYSVSDVFLLPTRYEIFGMVLLEAMYFHAPVITTHNGGSDMLIENNVSGIIEQEFDTARWCESIIRLLDDREFAAGIKVNAHRTIAENYTWDVLTGKFIEVFKKLPSQN